MTQRSLRFLGGDRADWQALIAISLLVAMFLLLGGCGLGENPVGPATNDGTDILKRGADSPDATPDEPAALAITAPGLGRWSVAGVKEQYLVCPESGQSVQFFWRGAGGLPLGDTPAYRHGWDVEDPENAADPGWAGPLGGDQNACQTVERVFWDGSTTLTIERWDSGRLLVRVVFELWVAPIAPRLMPQLTPAPNP